MRLNEVKEDVIHSYHRFYNLENGSLVDPIETQNYLIVQVGDTFTFSPLTTGNHIQYCDIEISYLVNDVKLQSNTNDVGVELSKDDAYLSLKDELHAISCEAHCRFQTLAVNFKVDSPLFAILQHLQSRCLDAETHKFHIPSIKPYLTGLISEFSQVEKSLDTLRLDALITMILTDLVRHEQGDDTDKTYVSTSVLPRIMHYLDKNFLTITSLTEIAARFGYSYNYLYKLFKRTYGETIIDYYLRKKMEYAKEEISKNCDLKKLSESLGYTSYYNFSRAFKNYYGYPPSQTPKESPKP